MAWVKNIQLFLNPHYSIVKSACTRCRLCMRGGGISGRTCPEHLPTEFAQQAHTLCTSTPSRSLTSLISRPTPGLRVIMVCGAIDKQRNRSSPRWRKDSVRAYTTGSPGASSNKQSVITQEERLAAHIYPFPEADGSFPATCKGSHCVPPQQRSFHRCLQRLAHHRQVLVIELILQVKNAGGDNDPHPSQKCEDRIGG